MTLPRLRHTRRVPPQQLFMTRISLENPAYYINREVSWLAFNQRVLEEAEDDRNPLLERVKFLAIAASGRRLAVQRGFAGL